MLDEYLKMLGLPPDTRSEEEKRIDELMSKKLKEYEQHFGSDFATEFLPMTKEEIIRSIDKCITHNRKWEGFIVPELEDDCLI